MPEGLLRYPGLTTLVSLLGFVLAQGALFLAIEFFDLGRGDRPDGPFTPGLLAFIALWGAMTGGGLGLPIRPLRRSLAMVAQGAVGFVAGWVVGWAFEDSEYLAILLGTGVACLSLGIAYAAWAPVIAILGVAGLAAAAPLGGTSPVFLLVPAALMAASIELGEAMRQAERRWVRWLR